MLTRMYLYSTSTKLSIDVWLYLDRPGSLINSVRIVEKILPITFYSNLKMPSSNPVTQAYGQLHTNCKHCACALIHFSRVFTCHPYLHA